MIRFILVILAIFVILLILRNRSNKFQNLSKKNFRTLIISILILGLLVLIATSGRYILPQILQLFKLGLPFLTKFIGF